MLTQHVDAVVLFAGGLFPEENTPNHLSYSRINQISSYLKSALRERKPHVIVCGGSINYHTGVALSEVSSDLYKRHLYHPSLIQEDHIISTQKGFCTVTEALAARDVIHEHGWKKIMFNTSREHEPRVKLILGHVLGKGYHIFANPFSHPDGANMNFPREEKLAKLYKEYFGHLLPGSMVYVDDKSFYESNLTYYEAQRSIIEGTARHEGDDMAYLRGVQKEVS